MTPDPNPIAATDPTPDAPAVRPPRRRRWWRLSLRAVMLVILVVGTGLGWQARRASLQRRAVATIQAAGGRVSYHHQFADGGRLDEPSSDPPPGPAWLRRWVGDEYFQEVAVISLPIRRAATEDHWAAIGRCGRVRKLTVGVGPGGRGVRQLAGLGDLRWLWISGPGLDDEALGSIGSLTGLEDLSLRGSGVTEAGLRALRPLTRLRHLWIDSAPGVTSAGVVPLIENNPALEHVSLSGTAVDDRVAPALGALSGLIDLDLRRTRVGGAGFASLGRAARLTHLDLQGTAVGDAELAHLAGLPQLVSLNISRTRVTDAGMAHLSRLRLADLKLDGAAVGDDGLHALRPLAGTLNILGLGSTRVTDGGIAQLAGFNRLVALGLEATHVTDASVPTLLGLPLENLVLTETPTTAEGHARLINARPRLSLLGRKMPDAPGS